MLAPTPPMGWNSWNTFGKEINEDLIRDVADVFVKDGLRDAGYEYVVIDDLWEADERVDGRLVPDPEKFPGGIKALADYVHQKGLKFGIYSCAGTHTCAGKPSSYGYEDIDAQTFAQWGVDFLKYDFCYRPPSVDARMLYARMGQALRASGRPMVYSICEWGCFKPWEWGASVGGQMWRTTGDICDSWESIYQIGFEKQVGLEPYAGPGHWNDPDMLVVGMYGKGNVAAGGCTDAEYRAHFSLWSLQCAPLIIGCDVRSMNDATRTILLNTEVIAVNQDRLGCQARRVGVAWHAHHQGHIWAKPLFDGSVAVGLFNVSDKDPLNIPVSWEELGIHDRCSCTVRDLWRHEDLGIFTRSFTPRVPRHDVCLVRVIPQK